MLVCIYSNNHLIVLLIAQAKYRNSLAPGFEIEDLHPFVNYDETYISQF